MVAAVRCDGVGETHSELTRDWSVAGGDGGHQPGLKSHPDIGL